MEATVFKNVLIGVDGRQGGRDAIALARLLAGPGATFTLAHAYGLVMGKGAAEALPIERQQSHEMLERERDVAGLPAELVVRGQHPVGRMLHEIAEERGVDLIVVGSTRHALLGRVLLGDDTRAALDGTPCATAVAPRGFALVAHQLVSLGVGYDGSPESEQALAVARKLAAATSESTIRALCVVSLQQVRDEKPVPADWPREADELIAQRKRALEQIDGIEGAVEYGGPREELIRFGRDLDLLIVGSRNYGPLGRLIHGSVSRYLVGHASCPVLVLPRAVGVAPAATDAAKTQEAVPVGPDIAVAS
jgi:nucleotide-binding universal stress UspA family protein